MKLTQSKTCFTAKPGLSLNRGGRKVARLVLAGAAVMAGFGIFMSAAEIIVETTTWTKYDNTVPGASDGVSTNGRIPLGIGGTGDDGNVFKPCVIAGLTNQMWYSGSDGANNRIYYATSPDGLTWTKYNNATPPISNTNSTGGRIPLGGAGRGDVNGAFGPSVIKDGATYKMWYTGNDGATNRIYYATSPDGLTWTKYTNAITTNSDTTSPDGRLAPGTPGTGDNIGVYYCTVIKDGATYKMWYTGSDGATQRFYYATSPDGLIWTKYNNTIPTNSDTTSIDGRLAPGTPGKGDRTSVTTPAVIKVGSTYRMWYSGSDGTNSRVYYATSPDGLTWTKSNNAIPTDSNTNSTDGRIPRGTAGKGDDKHVSALAVIRDGNTYKMWYSGYYNTDSMYRIYHATCAPPAGTVMSFR